MLFIFLDSRMALYAESLTVQLDSVLAARGPRRKKLEVTCTAETTSLCDALEHYHTRSRNDLFKFINRVSEAFPDHKLELIFWSSDLSPDIHLTAPSGTESLHKLTIPMHWEPLVLSDFVVTMEVRCDETEKSRHLKTHLAEIGWPGWKNTIGCPHVSSSLAHKTCSFLPPP